MTYLSGCEWEFFCYVQKIVSGEAVITAMQIPKISETPQPKPKRNSHNAIEKRYRLVFSFLVGDIFKMFTF